MRAALLEGSGRIRLKEMPDPQCPEDGVLVRVTHAGFCASDLKMWRTGHKDLRLPRVLGHEFCGFVVESRSDLWPSGSGQRVAVWPGVPCGACPACDRGLPHLCAGIEIMGFHKDGGFGEFVAVPSSTLSCGGVQPLPAGLASEIGTFGEPLACCMNAQSKTSVGKGDRVLIFGGGVLGRLNEKLARFREASTVVVVDTDPGRARGLENGFVADTDSEDWLTELRTAMGGGADVVIPACSDPRALKWGFSLLERGGRIAFFSGLGSGGTFPSPDHDRIHYEEWLLAGVYGCSPEHFQESVTLLASGAIDVNDLVSSTVSLDEVETGFQLMAEKKTLKVILAHAAPLAKTDNF